MDERSPRPIDNEARVETRAREVWRLMIVFSLSLRTWWIELCAGFDLAPMQGHALRVLDPDRPVPMSVLAESLICDASNVTGIVDKLESRGLIARQGADHDRRVKMLLVTPAGRAIRTALIARSMEPPASLTALPGDVQAQLASVLQGLVSEAGGTGSWDHVDQPVPG